MSNPNTNRPLSPHLQIYKPQITSVLSILHRITGFFLYIGLLLFVWWVICIVNFPEKEYIKYISAFFSSKLGTALLMGWSVGLFYHSLNGIRHLLWDIGKGFHPCCVTKSGILVLFFTVITSIFTWGIILGFFNFN